MLLLHGTGGYEQDLLPLAARFGPSPNVLSVRGNVSENGLPRFFRRIGMGLFDEKDIIFRAHELVHFVRQMSEQEGFNANQLVAIGYSNGANIAGAMLMLYPEFLAGAVLWQPMQPLTRLVPAFRTARRQPVLFRPGTQDPTVPPSASTGYVALLKQAGFHISRHDAHAGHSLLYGDVEMAAA